MGELRVEQEWSYRLDPETAAARLGLFMGAAVPEIRHGICPTCQAGVLGDLREHQPA